MPVDFSGRDELLFGDSNQSIFGDTPIYARERKSRGLGSRRPAATTTTTAVRGDTALGSGAIAASRAPRKSGSLPAAALIAAPAAIVLLGGAFFLMQPREKAPDDTLTIAAVEPAAPAAVTPELAPTRATPAASLDTTAVNPMPGTRVAAPAARAEAAPRSTQVARARPAPRASSAEDLGAEASATAPVATPNASASGLAVNPAPLAIPAAPATTAPATPSPEAVNPPPATTGAADAVQSPVPDASAVTP